MKVIRHATALAKYTIYKNEIDPKKETAVFLHGGPGFNSFAEFNIIGPLVHHRSNFIWFDQIGCGDSTVDRSESLTWKNQIDDIAAVIREAAKKPVTLVGHCLGAPITHDLMRSHRDIIRKVLWYSPVRSIPQVFKSVLSRAIFEKRLVLDDLSNEQQEKIKIFDSTEDENFKTAEVLFLLELVGKIRNFQELYWADRNAMQQYLQWMEKKPFNPEAFFRIQSDFFERGPQLVPDYSGIPVRVLHSDNDIVTPWETHGQKLLKKIPHAEIVLIRNGCHWIHLERPKEVVEATLSFIV